MELRLERDDCTPTRTIGRLFIGDTFECYTLEDPVRIGPKIPGETAIPAGRYQVVLTFSQRFQKTLPLLLNVPNFTGIRIHAGNTTADTAGCLLVGQNRAHDSILQSKLALAALQPKIAAALALGDDVWITIEEEHGDEAATTDRSAA